MLSTAKRLARRRLDEKYASLQALKSLQSPPKGWLRAIRDALGMTGTQFAKRLGVAWQSMDDLERSEAAGTIQLATLRRAAAALDCTLVYAVVPNQSLAHMVDERARAIALAAIRRVDHTMTLEDQKVDRESDEQLIEDYIRDHVRDRELWD
jgi:predicted DNA-binding mobile mystery protein A